MKPGDTVCWDGQTWTIDAAYRGRVVLRHTDTPDAPVLRRRPNVAEGDVELIEDGTPDIVCMGTNYRWGCYLQECECNVRCGLCPGERIKPGVWRCTCGEPFGGAA